VVGYQNHALGEVALYAPVFCLAQLASHARIAADPHLDGRPPVCHGGDDDAEVLLGHGHPGVEEVFAVVV
jgi:hypothetical protein